MEKRVASVFDLVRMCNSFGNTCKGCPLDGRGCCPPADFTEKDNNVIIAWCDEHPQKTYAQDFFEKFPKAKRYGEKCGKEYPNGVCRAVIFGKEKEDVACLIKSCSYCWNEVMPEDETK